MAKDLSQRRKAGSSVGAPAQHTQGSRKGKKAWRKHVDIGDIEERIEGLRSEERLFGSDLLKKADEELFQIDVKGDERAREALPRFSTARLTSTQILSQRSAVPAVFSRPTSSGQFKRKALTHEEKGRLLRLGKRPIRGPFNAVLDTAEMGNGSALLEVSEASKQSGSYDVWGAEGAQADSQSSKMKPKTPHPRSMISLPAVPSPHEGTSYNPLVTCHQELLRKAHENEERRQREYDQLQEMKIKLEAVRKLSSIVGEEAVGVATGMTVDVGNQEQEEEEDQGAAAERPVKQLPERKTKQERRKADRLRAEKRALADKIARKRMLVAVDSAKALRRALGRTSAAREQARVERQAAMQEKLKSGLAGQRLGKHKVPEAQVEVQLGEELSESLRQLKPEGNLFRDRFLSMQHRALIEPRVPVLPRKRKVRIKEYEKFAWKHFDREQ